MEGSYSKIKSIEDVGYDDVYCISVPDTGNFVANGMVIRNCDALRYACYTAFPQGEFSHPDENLTIEQLKRKIYQDEGLGLFGSGLGGYF